MSSPLPIAVVGAGIAGLACARALARAGHAVRVFDKGRAPGGRASTRRHPPHQFDHGAQYFTARSGAFRAQVEEWLASGVAAAWPGAGRTVRIEGGGVAPDAESESWYVGTPGMSALAANLARDLSVRCGEGGASASHRAGSGGGAGGQVWRISRDVAAGGWRLFDEAGAHMGEPAYRAVAISAPAPQAAVLAAASRPLAAAASAVVMRPCWAVMLAFESPLAGLPFDAARVAGSPVAWAARDSSKPGRSGAAETWVVHASHDWSEANLEASADDVVRILTAEFFGATGAAPLAPTFARAHRWRHAAVATAAPGASLVDPERSIGLCGDWFTTDQGSGRIESAYLSGLDLADRLVQVPKL